MERYRFGDGHILAVCSHILCELIHFVVPCRAEQGLEGRAQAGSLLHQFAGSFDFQRLRIVCIFIFHLLRCAIFHFLPLGGGVKFRHDLFLFSVCDHRERCRHGRGGCRKHFVAKSEGIEEGRFPGFHLPDHTNHEFVVVELLENLSAAHHGFLVLPFLPIFGKPSVLVGFMRKSF